MSDKLKLDQSVFFTAFPKDSAEKYVCRGIITKVPNSTREPYRVLIKAAAIVSVTGTLLTDRRLLIGRAISKYESELATELGPILAPKEWTI